MARRRFFATSVQGGEAYLAGPAARHLHRVLRARPGQQFELAHGGRLYLATVRHSSTAEVAFVIDEELAATTPEPRLELAVALFKFDRFEWMLEKAVELGVSAVQPLLTRHTEPRLAAAAPARRPRWEAILFAAAEQSRRADWPTLSEPGRLDHFLAAPGSGQRLLLSELPGAPSLQPPAADAVLLAGPEGGFAPEEFSAAEGAGFISVSLGPRILRVETAVLAALARCRT